MQLNIAAMQEAAASVAGERDCIVWRDRRLSWDEVTDRTRRFASVLVANGLGRHRDEVDLAGHESGQDHLAIFLHNGNEYLETMLGAYKARVAPFNVNYRYVAEELRYVLNDAAASAVVFHSALASTLAAVLDDVPSVKLLIQVPDDSGVDLLPGATWYEDALASGDPNLDPALVASWSPDDLYMLYTGGTTGMPKGVLWRQGDFLVAALGLGLRRDGTEIESIDEIADGARKGGLRALPSPPFMHGAAQWNAFSAWAAGGTVVVQSKGDRFDASDVLETIERERVSSLQIVGDAFAMPLVDALRTGDHDASSLRFLLSGGAMLSSTMKKSLLELLPGLRVVDVLGSSETGKQGVATATAGDTGETGRFEIASTATVLDESLSRLLEPGEEAMGWLAQRGPCPRGYLGDADKTARTFPTVSGERFAIPGDRALLRADGSMELLGRDSVTINSGGEKIFAEEVEVAVKRHEGVADALVVGRPSERWGNEVVAIITVRPDTEVTDDELKATAAETIARYKLPKAFVRVETVPRTASGKPDYRAAKEVAAAAATPSMRPRSA